MAKNILVIGAGRSSASLIKYLLEHAAAEDWKIKVGDTAIELAEKCVANHPHGEAFAFDALDEDFRAREIEAADFVVSMLPARFHLLVAKDCIRFKKNVITPSYVSKEMRALDQEAKDAGIIIMNEIGVDPGIDHMSVAEVLHKIEAQGGKIKRLESFTGGLIAPESDNNPWHYKFTWNPRNVVLAGQGGAAQFIQNGLLKYVPYTKLFSRAKAINIAGQGEFEGYANRDSLSYRQVYGIEDIPTIYRGTLRKKGFSEAWNVFVQLGCTDDSYKIDSSDMTWRGFINSFLVFNPEKSVEQKLREYLDVSDEVMEKLTWLGIFEKESVGLDMATPAKILQKKLEEKWSLEANDKDMIVMWHRFDYDLNGKEKELHSTLVSIGHDTDHTAMARTVGLPVAICTRLILSGEINLKGVQLPIVPELYKPVLKELASLDIKFKETEVR